MCCFIESDDCKTGNYLNNFIIELVKFLKKEGQDVNGGRCLRGIHGRFVLSEKDQKICVMWKEHMEKTINKENAWDQKTEINIKEGPVKKVFLEEITIAMKKMKLGKASELSEVSMEMINVSGKVEIDVMKLCQSVLDGKGISEDWKTSMMMPIYQGKGDVMNCCAYRGLKL